ncbi:hypothetical protein HPB48_021472 [Haemaphysalis longicornis]|uniref:Uncharacterized protein n=1 Tax=Haemaphysalis longicornis TaxID=44386 RepID=A0A9J6GM09_HAELO|nr:hypothetical protein HPB48_021472 [Haemaphysalis longicornis]
MASVVDFQNFSPNSPWQPRVRESIASRLPEGHYFFLPPSTHVFAGAEVYMDSEDSNSSSDTSFPAEEEEDPGSDLELSSSNSDEDESLAQAFALGRPPYGNTMDCDHAEQDLAPVITLPISGGEPTLSTHRNNPQTMPKVPFSHRQHRVSHCPLT